MKRIKPIQKCPDCACAAQRFASVNECYVKSSVEFDIRLSFSFGFMKQSRFRKTTLDPAKCHQSTVSESFHERVDLAANLSQVIELILAVYFSGE